MFIVEEIGIQYAKADGDNERRPSENKFKIREVKDKKN